MTVELLFRVFDDDRRIAAAERNGARKEGLELPRLYDELWEVKDKIKAPWAQARGLVEATVYPDVRRLLLDDEAVTYAAPLDIVRNSKHLVLPLALPGDDHCSLWLRDGRPAIWTTQPYPQPLRVVEEMLRATEAFRLELSIEAFSWHNPTRCLFVTWARTDRADSIRPAD